MYPAVAEFVWKCCSIELHKFYLSLRHCARKLNSIFGTKYPILCLINVYLNVEEWGVQHHHYILIFTNGIKIPCLFRFFFPPSLLHKIKVIKLFTFHRWKHCCELTRTNEFLLFFFALSGRTGKCIDKLNLTTQHRVYAGCLSLIVHRV